MAEFSNVLPKGMHISARLMAALTIPEVGTIHVARDGSWVIDGPDGETLQEGDGLSVPMARDYGDYAENLLAFITYAVEDPSDTFNAEVHAWATRYVDDLEIARMDLEGEV